MKLQDHLHYTDFQNELSQQKISTRLQKNVDAEEKVNGNNVRRFTRTNKTINIKWEYDWLLSVYFAKLDGMLWNCRMVKTVIAL